MIGAEPVPGWLRQLNELRRPGWRRCGIHEPFQNLDIDILTASECPSRSTTDGDISVVLGNPHDERNGLGIIKPGNKHQQVRPQQRAAIPVNLLHQQKFVGLRTHDYLFQDCAMIRNGHAVQGFAGDCFGLSFCQQIHDRFCNLFLVRIPSAEPEKSDIPYVRSCVGIRPHAQQERQRLRRITVGNRAQVGDYGWIRRIGSQETLCAFDPGSTSRRTICRKTSAFMLAFWGKSSG